jgi:SpoVK/Ycf46/Vps4 family AAA+-type ATPase
VFVIGTTSRPDVLDASLRRAGRFDKELALGIPDQRSRLEILKIATRF